MKAWIGAIALLSGLGAAAAQNHYTVTPLRLELSASNPTTVLTVIHRGDTAASMQIQQRAWVQREGRDEQEETRDLIISPAAFTFRPGETQVIRIALRGSPGQSSERAYRILVSEIPPPQVPSGPELFAFRIAIRMDLPLFVSATTPEPAVPSFAVDSTANRLQVRNDGLSHIRFTDMTVQQAGRQLHSVPVFTVLPGSTVAIELKNRVAAGSSVRVQADSNAGPISRDVPAR